MATLTGDFMKYSFMSKDMNHLRGTLHQCFAHDGIKALGVIDQYECGYGPSGELVRQPGHQV
jgi:hypothetical protein